MTQLTVGPLTIECVTGDITEQSDMDAVVNAANAALMPGGGVAGALHRAAGPGLARECEPLAPIQPGEAVITGGHDLPNRHVIHCLGPVYGRDEPAATHLANCYREALARAEEAELTAVAFPALSTGAFGYPMDQAAAVAVRTVATVAPDLRHVRHVRFVLADGSALAAHEHALNAVASDG